MKQNGMISKTFVFFGGLLGLGIFLNLGWRIFNFLKSPGKPEEEKLNILNKPEKMDRISTPESERWTDDGGQN